MRAGTMPLKTGRATSLGWSPASPQVGSADANCDGWYYWLAQTMRAIQRMSLVLKNAPEAESVSASR